MDFEKKESLRLLNGLETGSITIADAFNLADNRDPLIVYFVLRYLREKYPPSKPTSAGVVARVIELTKTYDSIVAKSKAGESDSVREWFDDTYELDDYFGKPSELIDILIEKIES